MTLIGMSDAAKIAGVSGADAIRTSLRNAGVTLHRIGARGLAVDDADLIAYIASRGGSLKPGPPRRTACATDETERRDARGDE